MKEDPGSLLAAGNVLLNCINKTSDKFVREAADQIEREIE